MKFSEKVFNSLLRVLPLPLSKWFYQLSRKVLFPEIRKEYFEKIVLQAKALHKEGDYLEFGVYRGKSMYELMTLFKKHGMDTMQYYAFDSFKGLPEAEADVFSKGEFNFPKAHFINRLKKSGFPSDKLHVVEGFFEDSLTPELKKSIPLKKAAFVHVDCDLYESTKVVLKWVEDYIDVGTVLIFDDYFSFDKLDNPEDFG
jgi:O-methyltransferase